jgi:hypothetical protein
MNPIEEFIMELAKQKNTSKIANPYLNDDLADNLRVYLTHMNKTQGKRVLLVGEAPGYKGCKMTGIPFTSGRVFEKIDHPLLKQIRPKLKISQLEAENTASIVWSYLSTRKSVPLFWNSFPFHPHPKGHVNKNRAPNAEEIKLGRDYLKKLYALYQPDRVAGIGHKGVECAKKSFPDEKIVYIRHPSYGGKSDFIWGMNNIIE